ncbi:helix-turn-helix domain-containing protein [Ralstonia insidiosa]|uniref:AraC family transcriptional regulator n=2 Tax=Burkholderiaceae TaxID=119060 RepID=A0A192A5V8_9RALS|nr:helix-turn-helix domain-containing protein [Ralstonia insidiosa]ANJ75870.1 AraC family transcriptional regulator [Ralstonia insidiosa]KAB0469325.1 helix-turn-helix domain-containing protein [Ralstonia insidiosa]MBY4910002.1 helix-turn-helix domain-containing protein [Ralstonia insidiosa]
MSCASTAPRSDTSHCPTGPRVVALVAYPAVQMLDVAGPADVFAMANAFNVEPAYRVMPVSSQGGLVRASNGIAIDTESIASLAPATIDTLIVAGGEREGLLATGADAPLAQWAREVCVSARRFGSVCTGAFVLAHWGLLDAHRATTHWASAQLLAQVFANVAVEPDALYVQDGKAWTSGGVTAGIDMCLSMVEQDLGRWVAARVAKQLILAVRRMGNQSQYSLALETQSGQYAALVDWLRSRLREPIDVEQMAAAAGEAPRTFHRRFTKETGMTPRAFLETLRLQAARAHLEAGDSVKRAARDAGFGSEAHLAKAFRRRFDLSPSQYQAQFGHGG